MKKILFICISLLSCQVMLAQSQEPTWKSGYRKELKNSEIQNASGVGSSIDEARRKAVNQIIFKRGIATGSPVVISGQDIVIKDDTMVVKSRILDEYIERKNGSVTVHLLAQTAKHFGSDFVFEPVSVTDEYPFSLRCFVPGMQQLYKGQKTKGLFFIVGEAACVGGIVLAEGLRANNASLINSTHDVKKKATYTDRANSWTDVRNGCIAAAAIVYVWNVVDAAISKGARHVVINQIAFTPYATTESAGFALNINF